MTDQDSPGADTTGTLALFPSEAAWARTQVLDARAIETCEFDLDAFARYRQIRILTYSSSVQMLHTVLERFAESRVECVLGYSRVVNNVASIIALQTAAIEEVHGVLRGLPASGRDDVLARVRDGRLQVRVVEGHVSHAKIFLLSDGPDGDRCVLTGSANFSTSALLGAQHEVLIRFRDDRAWEHFERQYLEVRDHSSAEVPIAKLVEQQLDPAGGLPPDAAPVLSPGRGAQVIQLARPAESGDAADRGQRVEKLYDVVLPALPKEAQRSPSPTLKLDDSVRKRFSGLIRRQTRRLEPAHPDLLPRPGLARGVRVRAAVAARERRCEGARRCRGARCLLGRLPLGVSRAHREAPARLLRLPVLDVLLPVHLHAAPPGLARGPRRHPLPPRRHRLRQVELGEDPARRDRRKVHVRRAVLRAPSAPGSPPSSCAPSTPPTAACRRSSTTSAGGASATMPPSTSRTRPSRPTTRPRAPSCR